MKKITSFILAFAMLFTLLPLSAFASGLEISGSASVAIPEKGSPAAQEQYTLTQSGVPVPPEEAEWSVAVTADASGDDLTAAFLDGVSISNGLLTVTDEAEETALFVCADYEGETVYKKVLLSAPAAPAALSAIAVKTMPSKTEYTVGEAPDYTGLTLTATFSDDSTETITSGFECSAVSTATAGVKTVTVTYQGKSTAFEITVLEDPSNVVASGTCGDNGDNVNWTLYDDGKLVISGTGGMADYGAYYNHAPWYDYEDNIKSVVIEHGVMSIGDYAFEFCYSLTSITISSGVSSIGVMAFEDCTSLTSVTIPVSVTSIGDGAFSGCTSLTSVTIPSGVTNIGYGAFEGCTALTSVTIPESVTSIGEWAFCNTGYYNNSSNWENDVLYIGKHLLKANDTISGAYTVKAGTKTIADYAFSSCHSLTSITIPESVTSIGPAAFYYCTTLTSITIPESVTSIGEAAFFDTSYYDNSSNWENDVLYIGKHLIQAKTSLSGAYTVKAGTKTIAVYAFSSCHSLTSLTIPESVTSIGDAAFSGCTSLTGINVSSESPFYSSDDGVLFNKTKTELICCPGGKAGVYTIPQGVTSIGDAAFWKCTSLTSITIPESVTSIGDCAFEFCYSLTSITISSGVSSIGVMAFEDCTSLNDVYYDGFPTQWARINIDDYNAPLLNAKKHFIPESVSVKTLPAKVEYYVGEAIDFTGLTLTAAYGDDTTETITSGFECSAVSTVTEGVKTVTVTFEGKTTSFDITVEAPVITSIYITAKPSKLTYLEAKDALDTTGGVITAYYSDNRQENIDIAPDMVSGFDNTKPGAQTLTVTYGGKTATFNITVTPKTLLSVAVTTAPAKLDYLEAKDALDLAGGKLTLYYNNDTQENIDLTADMVTGFDNAKVGLQTLTVTYEGKTATFEITVTPKSLSSIAVTTAPAKLDYLEGKDALDLAGGVITAYYNNDTQETVSITADMVTGFDNTKPGAQTLTVTYAGKTATFEITVVAKTVVLTELKSLPLKFRYYNGEALDLAGGVMTAYYDNDTQEDIALTADMVTGFESAKGGLQTLTVTYGGKTATFEVRVSGSDSVMIELISLPSKLTYLEGKDALNVSGGVLRITFKGDDPQDIPLTPELVTGFDNTKTGAQTLTVAFLGDSAEFEITVIPKTLISIAVNTLPAKTEYLEAKDELDLAGGKLTLYYDNDTQEDITLTSDMVSGFDNTVTGAQTLTVTYGGKETTFNISITPKSAVSIVIKTLPAKLAYLEAKDELDLAGGVITAYYDNDTQEDIAMTAEMVIGFDNTKPGAQTITVTVGSASATFDVTITPKTLKSISVSRLPDKTEYLLDTEPFDPAGGLLTLKYDNDTQEDIPLANAGISGFSNASSGERTLTVSYGGKMTFFRVNVVSVFTWRYDITKTSITLTNMPNVGSVYAVFRDGSGKIKSIKKMTAGEAAAIADGTAKISVIAVSDDGLPFISSVSLAAVIEPVIDDEGGWTPLF